MTLAHVAPPAHSGSMSRSADRPLVLVVGHAAGSALGGGERSLLPVLQSFDAIGIDVLVVLPPHPDAAYLDQVRRRSVGVLEMAVPERRPRLGVDSELVDSYEAVIVAHGVAAVHCNTIVPREPLVAARRAGVPAVVHAREVPHEDPGLEAWLDAPAEEIVGSVLAEADYVIANSRFTGNAYPLSGRTSVMPPTVDGELFGLGPREGSEVRIGMVGILTAKKGVRDLIAVAARLRHVPAARVALVGPRTAAIDELEAAGWPGNVELLGPASTPAEAMAQLDVVVNLSSCQEGFGRTVLEAMAAGRPVVAYDRGALSELVRDGETGCLVPFRDVSAVAASLAALVADPDLRAALGAAGRERALTRFSPERATAALAASYRAILPSAGVRRQSASDLSIPVPLHNRTDFRDPFYVGGRARFATATSVRFLGPDRLAAATLLGRELHVMSLDAAAGRGEITATVPTTDGARQVSADLLDFDGVDRIVTANCETAGISVYRLESGVPRFEASVPLDVEGEDFCHGVAWVPGRPDLVCVATNTGGCEAMFLSLSTGRRVAGFSDPGWVAKSVGFHGQHRMAVLMMGEPVGQDPSTQHTSKVVLVSLGDDVGEMTVLDEVVLPGRTVDGGVVRDGRLYAAAQADDAVLVYSIEDDRIRLLDELAGFSFPHDVDVSPDGRWVAVACYGTGDVRVRELPESRRKPAGVFDSRAALTFLRPKPSPVPLVRLGGEGDGAYLVPLDLDGVVACFSPGVNNTKPFEDQLVDEFGIACHLCDYTSDVEHFQTPLVEGRQTFRKLWLDVDGSPDSITLADWVSELTPDPADDLMLQMDIEGAEYRNLLAAPDEVLRRFRVILIEVHGLADILDEGRLAERLGPLLARLDRHFMCVHAHPNNCCGEVMHAESGMNLPHVIELTLLRRDRFRPEERDAWVAPSLPHPLDIAWNVPSNRPLYLNEAWADAPRSDASRIKELTDVAAWESRESARLRAELGAARTVIAMTERAAGVDESMDVSGLTDLAAGRPFRLTSGYPGCPTEGVLASREPFAFHTGFEVNAGITIDLGEQCEVVAIEVANRSDLCRDRARYLVAELHDSPQPTFAAGWPLRVDEAFLTVPGSPSLTRVPPTRTRYVTIFTPADTALHLSAVRVLGTRD